MVKVFDLAAELQLVRELPYAGGAGRIEFTADGSILSVPELIASRSGNSTPTRGPISTVPWWAEI